jgi:hypothetical protein
MTDHLQDILQAMHQQCKPIFEASGQSMYIFLDDDHKVCNKKFASLLGYASADAWARVGESFPMAFVDAKSRHALVSAYRMAMEKKVGSTNKIAWQTKAGKKVTTTVILVPIVHHGHWAALHFISKP